MYRYEFCEFANTVTHSAWTLPLDYYETNAFLPCRISKLKINKLSATIVKNQSFQLLWHRFFHLGLKLSCFGSNSIVIRVFMYVRKISKPKSIVICSTTFCYTTSNIPFFIVIFFIFTQVGIDHALLQKVRKQESILTWDIFKSLISTFGKHS